MIDDYIGTYNEIQVTITEYCPWVLFGIDRELYHLVSAVVDDPQSDEKRGMLADWLEDHGDSRAAEVRVTMGRRPWKLPDDRDIHLNGEWTWGDYRQIDVLDDVSDIPLQLLNHMRAAIPPKRYFPRESDISGSWAKWSSDENDAWRAFAQGFARWFGIK